MTFFGNILASSYTYYSKIKRVDPFFQAKMIIVLVQSLLFLVFLLIINEYLGAHVFYFLSKNTFVTIIIYAIVFCLNFKYYSKERMISCIQKFETKSLMERRLWAVIAVVASVLPLLLFFLILIMRHPVKQDGLQSPVTVGHTDSSKTWGITIEAYSTSLFARGFSSLANDSLVTERFKVFKEAEESEGVEWKSYNLYKQNELIVKIENNWENKNEISRITFYGSFFKTRRGISDESHFGDIKNIINTSQLNNSADGELLFHDKDFPQMAYTFDVTSYSKLYYGVNSISEIPDNLKISTIVVFRKPI